MPLPIVRCLGTLDIVSSICSLSRCLVSIASWRCLQVQECECQAFDHINNHLIRLSSFPLVSTDNFCSFVRIVNAWGFCRITTGLDIDSYYHEVHLLRVFVLNLELSLIISAAYHLSFKHQTTALPPWQTQSPHAHEASLGSWQKQKMLPCP